MNPATGPLRRRVAGLLTAACCSLPAVAQQSLLPRSGPRLCGITVLAADLDGVRWQRGAATGALAADQVRAVDYGEPLAGEPAAVTAGRRFAAATAAVLRANGPAAVAEASASLRALTAADPEHQATPAALLLLARTSHLDGTGPAALAALQALAGRLTAHHLGPRLPRELQLAAAELQLAAGDAAAALAGFRAVAAAAAADDDLRRLQLQAEAGVVECLVAGSDFAGAFARCRALAARSQEPAVQATALAAEGHARLQQALALGERSGLRRAELLLAEAAALAPAADAASAKADYWLGRVRLLLGDGGEAGTRAAARACWQAAARALPDNRWTWLAQKELAR